MKRCAPILAGLVTALPAAAPAEAGGWWEGRHASGSWGGRRDALAADGYTFFADYNAIAAANVSGGIDETSSAAGDLYLGVKVDLERVLGWEGTTFSLTGINRHGESIDPEVGGIYSVMQLVGGQTTFLYGVSLEKTFAEDTVSVKAGRITATDDFAGSPLYGYYLSNSINGQIRAVLFDGVMTSYPFPVWGARFRYAPRSDFRASVGVYQLTEKMFDPDKHGQDFAFRGSDGVSVFTQLDWDFAWGGRPGHFAVGANNTFSFEMEEFDSDQTSDGFSRLYLQANQQVYAESPGSAQGLELFATVAYTHREDVAIIPLQTSFGAIYTGLVPGRDRDRAIFGTTYGRFSDEYADEQEAEANGRPDYEIIFELGYRVQLSRFLYVQPDVQYVHQPGGTGDLSDATVLGVQFGVSL
jgi:porin